MNLSLSWLSVSVAALLMAGCGANNPPAQHAGHALDAGDDGGGVIHGTCGAVSWTNQVQPVVQKYCLRCHSDPPQYGAPHGLVTYAETQAQSTVDPSRTVYAVMADDVRSGKMPASGPAPTASEIQLISDWAAQGAPEVACPGDDGGVLDAGAPVDAGTIDLAGANFLGTAPDFVVGPDAGVDSNLYHCFPFTVHTEDGGARFLNQFAPDIVNSTILHHEILYKISGHGNASDYDCFGGPVGDNPQFIYGWAPGGQAFHFPPDVGFPIADGDQFVLQIHYHNYTGTSQTDASGVAMWWTDQPVSHKASVVMLGTMGFTLPTGDAAAVVQGTCSIPANTPVSFQVFAAIPHMHLYGTKIQTTRTTAQGQTDPLVSVAPWNFDNQIIHPVDMVVSPGDVLTTSCQYDTRSATGPVHYGETTEDEMCFDFLYLYPSADIDVPGSCLQ